MWLILRLIVFAGARPNNIIAFTFTEKAAAELKERIVSRCREELGEVHGMAEMYAAGTGQILERNKRGESFCLLNAPKSYGTDSEYAKAVILE